MRRRQTLRQAVPGPPLPAGPSGFGTAVAYTSACLDRLRTSRRGRDRSPDPVRGVGGRRKGGVQPRKAGVCTVPPAVQPRSNATADAEWHAWPSEPCEDLAVWPGRLPADQQEARMRRKVKMRKRADAYQVSGPTTASARLRQGRAAAAKRGPETVSLPTLRRRPQDLLP